LLSIAGLSAPNTHCHCGYPLAYPLSDVRPNDFSGLVGRQGEPTHLHAVFAIPGPHHFGLMFAHTFMLNECPCLNESTPVLRSMSVAGFLFGTAVAFRLGAMAICFLFFSYTTDPFEWGLSMYKAGIPYKGAFMFASAMRFYPLLQEEFITIQDALKARGSDLLVKWYNPVRLMWGVLTTAIPMGLGGLRRSRNIALSMELRGFSFPEETGVQRQLFRDIQLRPADYIIISVWVAIVVIVAILRLTGIWSAGPLVLG